MLYSATILDDLLIVGVEPWHSARGSDLEIGPIVATVRTLTQ